MKKNILALAVGAAVTALTVPAMAADVKVSGRAHMSVDQMSNGDKSKMDLSSNSSRIRFSGKTDVAEGLTAMMQLEQTINFDRRTKSDVFTSRDSFFGLKGDFGMVRLGYFDTPTKKVRSKTDMFGDRVGDARNMTQGTFDQRFHNSIHYQTPSFGGLQVDVQYSTDNRDGSADQTSTVNVRESHSTSLSYKAGDLFAVVAYESQGQNDGVDAKVGTRAGVTYNLAKGFKLAGFFESADKNSNDNTVMGVGAYYDLNSDLRLRGQYYMAGESSAKKDGASMLAVGVDRKFGKDLTLYAVYGMVANGDNASFTVTGGGHGSEMDPVAAGKDVNAISLGAIYNF